MSADVLPFTLRTKDQSEIPTPYYYRPGDSYVRLNITEETGGLLFPGACLIILRGHTADGLLHLYELRGKMRLGRISQFDKCQVRVGLDPRRGETVPLAHLAIVGAVTEIYPAGLTGPRLIVHRPDRARTLALDDTDSSIEAQPVRNVG